MSNSTELMRGKKVIVIGGSSGVGRSVAPAVLAHGAHVVIASSSQERVDSAITMLKEGIRVAVNVSGQAVDLQDFESLKAFWTKEGPFDHLVITAGNISENTTRNFPRQEFEINDSLKSNFDMRYWATIIAAQHIHKNKSGGPITQMIGTSSHRPPPDWGIVSGLMGAIAFNPGSGHRSQTHSAPSSVNTICLGAVDTEAHALLPEEVKSQMFESLKQSLPVGHVGCKALQM